VAHGLNTSAVSLARNRYIPLDRRQSLSRWTDANLFAVLLKSEDGDFEATIRLQFGATPIMLQGWSIVDEEGHNITIELLSPRIGMPLEDALFNPPPNGTG
jgi:hypothetical protein